MLVLSLVIGPPDEPCLLLSLRVRSGLIACQLCPSLPDLNSSCAPMNKSLGLRGERTMGNRSEEHTSELQSRGHLVCRLLLEKKKQNVHMSFGLHIEYHQ